MKHYIFVVSLYLFLPVIQAATLELPKGIIASPVRTAPALRLSDMDGKIHDSTNYRGQWLFVHFWASWCGPCRKEMPHIQTLVKNMQGQGLAFMFINTAESEDTVFTFLGGVAPELQSLLDHDGLVTEQWQPRGLPATYLVDPEGVIRFQALGGRSWHEKTYMQFLKKLKNSDNTSFKTIK